MKTALRLAIAVLTPLLIVVGTLRPEHTTSIMYISGEGTGAFASSKTPESVIESVMGNIKMHRYHDAYLYVANLDQVDEKQFTSDMRGSYGSLRVYSGLQDFEYHVLRKSDDEAVVRTTMEWSTSVGQVFDTRDLKVVRHGNEWKVVWPEMKQPQVPPQIIPVNYSAWNVIQRGSWADTQAVRVPTVRVTSTQALSHGNATVVVGEVVNEDTIPAFVSIEASLVDSNGSVMSQESSFDKMIHVLLPNQKTPFRLDFPGVKLSRVKSVRIQPESSVVQASTDPVIRVGDEHLDVDARGRHTLAGQLMNESGKIVNIPHVVASYYDGDGKIVWVSHGYVDKPLLPQTTVAFALDVPDDIAPQVTKYQVVVNDYRTDRY